MTNSKQDWATEYRMDMFLGGSLQFTALTRAFRPKIEKNAKSLQLPENLAFFALYPIIRESLLRQVFLFSA